MSPVKTKLISNLVGAMLGLTVACSGTEAAAGEQAEPAQGAEGTPATLTSAARDHVRTALSAYERMRAALVADRGDVAGAARDLATAAEAARAEAPEALRPHLTAMATEAQQLASAPASDLPRLRREFGDVSRHVVALLTAEASLAQGLHVFECPMAEGYGRWVQPSADISNPYMGTRMPACGTETSFDG